MFNYGFGMLLNSYRFSTGGGYLLDTYSAAGAYSLRQLKTGVANVVRVRRSSDNAESDFTATEVTDGTLTTWTGANDGFVVTWYDQGTAGRDLTQATATNQPKLVSSGSLVTKNSNPTIQFDSSDILSYSASGFSELDAGNVWTSFVVGSPTNNNAITYYSYSAGQFVFDSRTSPTRIANVGTTWFDLPSAQNNTDQRLLVNIVDDTGSKTFSGFANGVANTPSTWSGTYANSAFWRIDTASTVQMQEVIIYGSDESSNRNAIETDINGHYSIY